MLFFLYNLPNRSTIVQIVFSSLKKNSTKDIIITIKWDHKIMIRFEIKMLNEYNFNKKIILTKYYNNKNIRTKLFI